MLQGRELITAACLACKGLADAVLCEHGVLRAVLPSAPDSCTPPQPLCLAALHVQKMPAAKHVHIMSKATGHMIGPFPAQDAQYLTTCTRALQAAWSATGSKGLAATSLHIEMTGTQDLQLEASRSASTTSVLIHALAGLPQLHVPAACRVPNTTTPARSSNAWRRALSSKPFTYLGLNLLAGRAEEMQYKS